MSRINASAVLLLFVFGSFLSSGSLIGQEESQDPERITLADIENLLSSPSLVKELEISAEQLAALSEIDGQWEVRKELLSRSWPDNTTLPADPVAYKAAIVAFVNANQSRHIEMISEQADELMTVFLPFQKQRINQIRLQQQLMDGPFLSVFSDPKIDETLDISAGDARRLRESSKQLATEYQKELRELKLKFHSQIRESQEPDLRRGIEELTGEPWIPSEKN